MIKKTKETLIFGEKIRLKICLFERHFERPFDDLFELNYHIRKLACFKSIKIYIYIIKQPSLVPKFASYFTKLRFGILRIIRSPLSKFNYGLTEDRNRIVSIGLRLRTPKRRTKS